MKTQTAARREPRARGDRARSVTLGGSEPRLDATPEQLVESDIFPDPIVCVSDLFWDEHWSSEQQLMSRLAKRTRVLYVERPVSFLSFFTKSSDASVGRQLWRSFTGNVRKISPNLTILTPYPVFPLRFVKPINAINEWLRRRSITQCLKKRQGRNPILWIYPPDAGRLVGKIGERLSLYYCADDWAALDQWWNKSEHISARENELAAKVNLIVGTSTKIVEHWKKCHAAVTLISNGADVQSFVQAREIELDVPSDLLSIPKPRIGYIGFVDGRFDAALYQMLAIARPKWNFIIIGPLNERSVNLTRLRALPNVHFLGGRARAALPAYLKGFDVCTIPYVLNKLSESIFPLKLFEYVAAGRPVVATALPELKPFHEYVRVAGSAQEFEAALELSMNKPHQQASKEFLLEHSWDTKAELLWTVVIKKLEAVNSTMNR